MLTIPLTTRASALLLASATSLFIGCTNTDTPSSDRSKATETSAFTNGLNAAERQELYHLVEGSELFPLSWVKALESKQTGKPFLEQSERFGLIADPANADGVPVGISVGETRDMRMFGVKMTGINCAACHVNEITYKGTTMRIDGAPGLFNAHLYQKDLGESIGQTLSDRTRFLAFIHRLRTTHEPSNPHLAGLHGTGGAKVGEVLTLLPQLEKGGGFGADFSRSVHAALDAEARVPARDLGNGVILAKHDTAHHAILPIEWRGAKGAERARDAIPQGTIEPGSRLHALGADALVKAEILPYALHDVVVTYRLLRDRLEFVMNMTKARTGGAAAVFTDPGFGRVDAFITARNLLFPNDQIAVTSPVSYPSVWGFAKFGWLHWDGNTNSVLERNIGQAIGTGALFDKEHFTSTLDIKNIHRLETLARQITPPAWPVAVFGAIDKTKAATGETLFKRECAGCHGSITDSMPSRLSTAREMGTDPARSDNFNTPVGSRSFTDAVVPILRNIKKAAFVNNRTSPAEQAELEWGVTPQWFTRPVYVARPLASIWASAPYLHNGSVPTLYDLLLPAAQRPKTFPIGHREYDPVKVGYTTTVSTPIWTFRADSIGNRNTGHEYGTALTQSQRLALLEYLKQL